MDKQILLCTAKNEIYRSMTLPKAEPVIILHDEAGVTVWSKFDEARDGVHYFQVDFCEVDDA